MRGKEGGQGASRRRTFGHATRTPTPALPDGEGALFDASCKPQAFWRLRVESTSYELQGSVAYPAG